MSRIIVADDDRVSQTLLVHSLTQAGYSVVPCQDGTEALRQLQHINEPTVGILDWMMPGLDGLQVCQAIREQAVTSLVYLILLTSKGEHSDIVEGLEGGADDYMVKPVDLQELRARVKVGIRVLTLQEKLEDRVHQLEQALAQVKQLQGLLPICSYCKKIRNDGNYWQQVEEYVSHRTDVQFSHGICPHCFEKELAPQIKALKEEKAAVSRTDK